MYHSTYDKIDEILKERGMSRRKLAQKAGINVNTMSTLFAKKADKFPEKYLNAIADALEVSPLTLRASNICVLASTPPAKAKPFDENKINKAVMKNRQIREQYVETASEIKRLNLSQFIAGLEVMDDEELEIISQYIEYLKKKRSTD